MKLPLFLRCHFARTQTSIGRSCSNPQTGHVRQHDTSTSSGPGYTRRGGRHDAGRAPRPLAASPQRQPPRPLRFFESSTPAAARLPGPSPSTKGHLRTLRDRGGRPLSRASRQRAAEAHTAAATRQRWAKGRGRPHGSFPQRRGRFMKKREEKRRRPSFFLVGLVSS